MLLEFYFSSIQRHGPQQTAFIADDYASICSRGYISDELFIRAPSTYVFSTERNEVLTKEMPTKITLVSIHLTVLNTQFRMSRIHPYFTRFQPRRTNSSCNNRHNRHSTEIFEKNVSGNVLTHM